MRSSANDMHSNSDCTGSFADGIREASADCFRNSSDAISNNEDGMRSDTFRNCLDGTRSSANGINTQVNFIRNSASGKRSSAEDVQSAGGLTVCVVVLTVSQQCRRYAQLR